MIARFASLALFAWALVPSAAQAAGPVCDAVWRDAARDRGVPVRIRMPDGSAAAPVILFSHGLGGSVEAGTAWARAWAGAGFVVIHLQHPGSDRSVLTGGTAGADPQGGRMGRLRALRQMREAGGRDGIVARLRGAMTPEQLGARVADVKFVLDRLAAGPKREGACDLSRIDLNHVGMAGHSFGAHTTQALAGQRFAGTTASAADPRIAAFIAFSPSPPRQDDDIAATAAMTKPFFSVTGTADASPLTPDVTAASRERVFRAMPPGNKYLLVIAGGTHADFSGSAEGRAHREPSARIAAPVIAATTAFWRWTLMGDAPARRTLDDPRAFAATLDAGDRFERR